MGFKKAIGSPPEGKGLDWDKLREQYAERRRQEGATEEEIAAEQIADASKVVWSKKQSEKLVPRDPEHKPPSKSKGDKALSRQESGKRPWVTESEREAMVTLYRQGLSMIDIGKRLDRSNETVSNQLKKAGVL